MKRLLLSLSIAVSALQVGCPDSSSSAKPSEPSRCVEKGDRCQLGGGVIGVCNDAPCPAGKAPPCLACISQH